MTILEKLERAEEQCQTIQDELHEESYSPSHNKISQYYSYRSCKQYTTKSFSRYFSPSYSG
jgi:hypothetical protein